MRTLLLPLLCLPLALSSCLAVAGVAGGLAISQPLLEKDVIQITVDRSVDATWAEVRSFLSDRCTDLIEVEETDRICAGRMNGAKVTIAVLAYDARSTHVRVVAQSYGINDVEATELTVAQLLERFETRR